TGEIAFDVVVVPLQTIPGVYRDWRIVISPHSTEDARAICEVILNRTAEPTAFNNLVDRLEDGIRTDQLSRPPLLRMPSDRVTQEADNMVSPGGGLYEACTRGANYLGPGENVIVEVKIDAEDSSLDYHLALTDSNGAMIVDIEGSSTGST